MDTAGSPGKYDDTMNLQQEPPVHEKRWYLVEYLAMPSLETGR
jgi:hypothetical protein